MADFPRTPLVTRYWSKVQLQNQPLSYTYSNFVINTVDSTKLPSNATGWFNPWGPRPLNVGFVQLPPPVATVVVTSLPPGQSCMDLPPRAPQRCVTLLTHTDSFKLPLQQVIQPNQYDWPNPRDYTRGRQFWVDYILPQAQAPPIGQYDWPNPRSPARLIALGHTDSFKLPIQEVLPPRQTDWPVTPAPRRNPQDWSDSFKLPLQQVLPPNLTDWPVPRGPRPIVRDWTDSFKLPLQQTLPPSQTDWPNPRGPRPVPQGQSTSSNIALFSVQANPGYDDWANPFGPRRVLQDWIAPTNIALTAVVAPTPPPAQYDWPVPRGAARLTALGHTDSFKLPLQQVIQPNQYDWPVPKGARPVVRDWTDSFKLPLQQTLPPNQTDWPVSKGPRPLVRDWADSFKLPLQQVLPPNQTDWPVPKAARRNPQDWLQATLITLTVAPTTPPPAQYDWPNPRAPQRAVDLSTWAQSPRPPEPIPPDTTNLPCTVGGWFNPWGPRRSVDLLTWINSTVRVDTTVYVLRGPTFFRNWVPDPGVAVRTGNFSTPLVVFPTPTTPPIAQHDWPNPRGALRASDLGTWTQSPRPPEPDTTNLPCTAANWFNPWGPQQPNVGSVQSSGQWLLSPVVTVAIIRQADWPTPRGPRPLVYDWSDSFKLPLQQVLPPRQTDWPVPSKARRNPQDWVGSTPLALTSVSAVPAYADWFNPWGPRRVVQDWIAPTNIALTTIAAAPPPIAQYDWPVPRGSRPVVRDWWDSFKLPLQQTLPQRQTEWPVTPAPRRNPQDWQSYTLPISQSPVSQTDWPNPVLRKPPVVADWFQSPSIALTYVTPPFNQYDWPVPKTKVGVLQVWSDSFKLPLQGVLPPTQKNWPLPTPAARRNPQDYLLATNITLYTTVQIMPPIAQRDWPVPKGPRQPVITSRDFVAGSSPPSPVFFDPNHALRNEIRRVRYLNNSSGRVRYLKNEVRS